MSNTRLWTYTTNPVQQLTPPAIKRLSEVKCPALVILGEQDLPHIKEVAGCSSTGSRVRAWSRFHEPVTW